MKRILGNLILASLITLYGCVEDPETKVFVTGISVSPESLILVEGESQQIYASVIPSNATETGLLWNSSNFFVLSVSDSGVVTALNEGTAAVTITSYDDRDITNSCIVTVLPATKPVTGVTLDTATLELVEGDKYTFTASIKPDDATNKNVTWQSSDTDVASVDQDGSVLALAPGSTVITVETEDGHKTSSCSVTVKKRIYNVSSVALDMSSISMTEGDTRTLVATVYPENATNKNVSWKTSASRIASVDKDGTVTAVSPGNAVITVTAEDGGATAECKVTVKEHPKATSLSLSSNSFNANIGQTYGIEVSAYPSESVCEFEWSISNTDVASLSGSGSSVSLYTKDYGSTVLTVKEKRSNLSKSISIQTCLSSFSWNENTGETYSTYPLVTVTTGSTYQLHYTCKPSYATNIFSDLSQLVFYESGAVVNSPSYISIDKNGLVKGLKPGTTGIKATGALMGDGSRVYIKVVDPYYPVTGITLNKSSLELMEGAAETLNATIAPSNATDKSVTWKSDNTNVATVSNGTVRGVKEGTATITVTSNDSGKSASCTVKVKSLESLKGYHNNHEYIDLGLSVKWATYNIGGSSSSPVGRYYLWGDANNSGEPFFYDPPKSTNICGTKYDAARYSWGGSWRLPTMSEIRELVNNCKFEATTSGGVSGLKVTGPNGGSMFMPATGMAMPDDGPVGTTTITDKSCGYYLSGEAQVDSGGVFFKYYKFTSSGGWSSTNTYNAMFVRMVIRPVVNL